MPVMTYDGFPFVSLWWTQRVCVLIGFVWTTEVWIACTGGQNVVVIVFRGESSYSMSVSHTVHWTNGSVSLLVLQPGLS